MNGKVISYDSKANTWVVESEDGKQFTMSVQAWTDLVLPTVGLEVSLTPSEIDPTRVYKATSRGIEQKETVTPPAPSKKGTRKERYSRKRDLDVSSLADWDIEELGEYGLGDSLRWDVLRWLIGLKVPTAILRPVTLGIIFILLFVGFVRGFSDGGLVSGVIFAVVSLVFIGGFLCVFVFLLRWGWPVWLPFLVLVLLGIIDNLMGWA